VWTPALLTPAKSVAELRRPQSEDCVFTRRPVIDSAMLNDTDFLHIVDATPLVSIDLIVRNERGEVLLGRRANRPRRECGSCPAGAFARTNV